VEQLAEVFRYTLRRSETEWARLEDEADFARAYLDVEQARFGPRLAHLIEIAPDVRDRRVPAMMLQTLVENAVKHGVAAVRGEGRVEIRARADGDRLRIEVADNGPGFGRAAPAAGRNAAAGRPGLPSRLRGHFGVGRPGAARRGGPSVAITLPIEHAAGRREGAA
jgi:two-component system sensor histidine kinase AlgZ